MTLQIYDDQQDNITTKTKKQIQHSERNLKRRKFVKVKCCKCGLEYEVVHKTNTSRCWDCLQEQQRITAGIGRKSTYDLGGY